MAGLVGRFEGLARLVAGAESMTELGECEELVADLVRATTALPAPPPAALELKRDEDDEPKDDQDVIDTEGWEDDDEGDDRETTH